MVPPTPSADVEIRREDGLSPDALRELLSQSAALLNSALDDLHPFDIADAAAHLDDDEVWSLLSRLEPPRGADVFSHLPIERQAAVAETRDPHEVADLLEAMPSDDRVDLVQQLPEHVREAVLHQMEAPERADVEKLAVHKEGTAGSVMSTEFATLKSHMTVQEAVDHLRRLAQEKETIYYNYVTDEEGRLLGIISLRDLVLDDGRARLEEVMNRDIITVRVDDDVEDVARRIREYDLLALPVLQGDDRLAGIITVDDVMDVAEREAAEDFDRLAAVEPVRGNVGAASFWLLYRKRIPWLFTLVFVNLLSGAGIAYFEETIEAVVALVFFLPLLIASSGNAGAQASTLMVRALATGEVATSDWLRLLGREVVVAAALGVTMGLGVAAVAGLRAQEVMLVVGLTMVIVVVVGSLMGMLLPFIFQRFNLDPATASGPLITSLADVLGVLIYFGIATWLLRDLIAAAQNGGG